MITKILTIFIVPLFFFSCDYSPLYSDLNNKNINIKVLQSKGDQEINNHLLNNLEKYSKKQGKIFFLKIDTNFSILDKSKNLEGSISDYQLIVNTKFIIENDNLNKTITIQEDIIMKNLSDNFEKRNYEKSIKKNFSNSITNRLILQLNVLK